jgi:hypothetical protein
MFGECENDVSRLGLMLKSPLGGRAARKSIAAMKKALGK